jgi:NAD(P)-dependent dehydrogenase (short-subunit alcohol dehydrogenase family)
MNVVVTGASRGIGLELVREALTKGDQVLAVARQPKESTGLSALKKQFGNKLSVCAVDVGSPEAADKIAASVSDWPTVDVLFNNAGIFRKDTRLDDFNESFRVNSVAPFLITKALLPKLRKSQAPRVVQITSLMGSIDDNSSGGSYAYRASKSALNMLNKCLAVENEWLTTVVMHPGWVKTDMGGGGAPVEIPESAGGLWKVARGLKDSDSGGFFDFRGKKLPW